MSKKWTAAVGVAMLIALTAWAGKEPWTSKPYQQWDMKEIGDVLTNSPWVRVALVDAYWRGAAYSKAQMGKQYGGSNMQGSVADMENTGNTPQPGDQAMTSGGNAEGSQAQFMVRWNSSRTIREALARGAVLNHQINEAQAEKYVSAPAKEYEIAVLGSDMTPFAKAEGNTLKEKTFLEIKGTKRKVAPTNVRIQRSKDGKKIQGVLFAFPKTGPGTPEITPEVKSVEFICTFGQLDLRVSFDPRRMVDRQGSDL